MKFKLYSKTLTLGYFFLGILMLIVPKFVCDTINYIIGASIILFGIVFLIKLLKESSQKEINKVSLLIGLFFIIFGVFLMLNTSLLVSILPIAMGIIILIDAISQINNAINLKEFNSQFWYINLIVGILFIVLAVYIIFNAPKVTYLAIRIIGGILIFDGLFNIYTQNNMKKYNKKVEIIEATIKDNN